MTLEQIKDALQDRRIDKVMEVTGLSRPTISAIRDGVNTNPTLDTLEKLTKYFSTQVGEQ